VSVVDLIVARAYGPVDAEFIDNDNCDVTDDGDLMLAVSEKGDTHNDADTLTRDSQATATTSCLKLAVMQKLCHGRHW
jgi:hypothetical protein